MSYSLDPFKSHFVLISSAAESSFSKSLQEAHLLYVKNPSIEAHIVADQDAFAKQNKLIRLADKAWKQSRQPSLPCIEQAKTDCLPESIILADGRPRMPAFMVFVCVYIRGQLGGIKSKSTQCFLEESTTFKNMCYNLGVKKPGASTIIDNLNIVSAETLNVIHKAQILNALDESLDTFDEVAFDSTSVKGNVSWPTESNLLYLLVKRIYHMGSQLNKFNIIPMHERNFPKIIKDLNKISTKIALESGKPKCILKRKSDYNSMLGKSRSAKGKFDKEMVKIEAAITETEIKKIDILPSHKKRLLGVVAVIKGDIINLQKVIDSSTRRVMKGEKVATEDKVLSLSDADAAMIIKGGRDTVLGYKPQIGRSKNGFVSVLIVPEGNAADTGQLNAIIEKHVENTNVTPTIINVDDGYANKKVREEWMKKGVEVFSISGAKGKRSISDEEWESEAYIHARNDRSAVESIMYCLKFGYNLGRLMRRGLENVRNEMMEKILAYNFDRTVLLKQRQLSA
ncbi:MAG: transposase [Mariprofundaceae bacterium]|nr:transposase [Mariprofundaceae bacterium]